MEPRVGKKSRFKVEKLEDRIAPSLLQSVNAGVTGNDSTGFTVQANADTNPQTIAPAVPAHPGVDIPTKVDAGSAHLQVGDGTPIHVLPATTTPTPLVSAGVEHVHVGIDRQSTGPLPPHSIQDILGQQGGSETGNPHATGEHGNPHGAGQTGNPH